MLATASHLAKGHDDFPLLAEAIPQLVWVANAEGDPIHFNQRWVSYTGSSLRAVKSWEELLHPDDWLRARTAWQACLATGEPYDIEYRLRRVDGIYRWHLTRGVLITDMHRRPRLWMGTCTDIQVQKEAAATHARKLAAAQALADQGLDSKNHFLANMSHEIRTPLHGIMGIADVLLETHLDDQQLSYAKLIKRSGSGLLSLVDDISDLAKMDTGKLLLAQVPFDMLALVQDQADALSFRAIDKHLSLMTYVDPAIPLELVGDPGRLAQVLLNLVTNAIMFTNTGLVSVRVTLEDKQGDTATVRFSVEDTGMGMAPEMQTRLFEPFMEGEAAGSHKFGGTGLGLSIAKRLVSLMGGEICVTSEVDCGTTFFFVVPLQMLSQPQKPRPVMCLDGKRIMVVDDDVLDARILLHYLQNAGARTTHRSLGTEALRQLRRVPRGFDVVIIDKRLSDIDGVTLARQIKGDPALAHLRLLLVSNQAQSLPQAILRSAGLEAFVAKPVRKTDLIAAVANACETGEDHRGGK